MKNHFSITCIIIVLIFLLNTNTYVVQGGTAVGFKIALIMSDGPQDLGFNYQLNEAKVATERALNLTQFYSFVKVPVPEAREFFRDLCKQGYKGVIISSLEYNNIAKDVSFEYPSVQFLLRGSEPANGNRQFVTYNFPQTSYVTGYFSGLLTKTGKLGYVQPGPPISNNYPGSAFYVGATNANPNVTCESYTTGGWISVELSTAATNTLLDSGIDIIGQTQNDLSVSLTAIERGYVGMGTNGFPLGKIFGNKIAFSYVLNWTDCFVAFATKIVTYPDGVGYVPTNYYGDYNNNFITYIPATNIAADIIDKLNAELGYVGSTPRAQSDIYCGNMTHYLYGPKFSGGKCITQGQFQNMNDPYPGYTWYGNYSIPITLRDIPREVTLGFNIVSGICIALALVLEFLIFLNRNRAVIRSASPIFCYLIIFGGMIVYAGIISWTSSPSTSHCHARYWLVTLGFTVLIGSLVVKNFRIWLIFDNPELKTIKITNYQLFPWVGGLIAINSLLMAIISGVGNITLVKVMGIDDLGPYEYLEKCSINSKGNIALYILLGYFAVLLLVGVFVSWKIRIVDIAEFNESKPIANTLYAISFSLFVIVSLVVSPQSVLDQNIILCIAGLFITTSALSILFIPKLYSLANKPSTTAEQLFSKKKSTVATQRGKSSSGGSKNSGSVSHSGMQANILAEFSESDCSEKTDTEITEKKKPKEMEEILHNSIHPTLPEPEKPTGPVLAVFTDDSLSDTNDDEPDDNIFDENNNNNV